MARDQGDHRLVPGERGARFEGRGARLGGRGLVRAGAKRTLVVVPGSLAAPGMTEGTGRPFCEASGTWCEQYKDHLRRAVPEDDSLTARLTAGDLGALAELPPPSPDASRFLRVDVWTSDAPDGTAAYRIQSVTLSVEEGKLKTRENALTRMFLLTREELGYLADLAKVEPQPTPPDAPPAAEE